MRRKLEFTKTKDMLLSLAQADTEIKMLYIEAQQLSCANECMPGDWRDVELNPHRKCKSECISCGMKWFTWVLLGLLTSSLGLNLQTERGVGSNLDFATSNCPSLNCCCCRVTWSTSMVLGLSTSSHRVCTRAERDTRMTRGSRSTGMRPPDGWRVRISDRTRN